MRPSHVATVTSALLALSLSAPAHAANARFTAFGAKFKAATLPLTLRASGEPGAKLSDAEVVEFVLAPSLRASGKGLADLQALWSSSSAQARTRALLTGAPEAEGASLTFTVGSKATLKDLTLLTVRVTLEQAMSSSTDLYLLTWLADGTLASGAAVASQSGSEAGGGEGSGTLAADGALRLTLKNQTPLHDLAGEEHLDTASTRVGTVGPGYALELGDWRWDGPEGHYVDPKSKEVLTLIRDAKGLRAWYQPKADKPYQPLTVEGDPKSLTLTTRFKKSPKPYVLTWPATRASLSCKNPDGSVQRFDRGW